ncbi:MAG: bifunctional riboflavin kinase/FAD synthetase [Flavobacteriales bacterium]|nr:bifunctional riboflavin kinase/FAD synthetase [Flavobacteriales bacterium]
MRIHTDIESIEGIQRPVLTIGTFDGVHLGHKVIIDRLNEIAAQENGESVLLTFHPHPRIVVQEAASIELLTTMDERLALLREAGLQHVIIHPFTKEFSRISALAYVRDLLVNQIGVHYAVVGYDHHFGRNREGDIHLFHELAEVYGFKVEEISAQTIKEVKVSSTKVRNALREGNLQMVRSYLGYDYSMKGTVVKGDGRGTGIGFPTANILPDDQDKLIPAQGVYAVRVTLEGGEGYIGMMNIGTRPTFISDLKDIKLEVHLLEFTGNLYGQQIHVCFVSHIRGEMKFENVERLKAQLVKDRENVIGLMKDH